MGGGGNDPERREKKMKQRELEHSGEVVSEPILLM